MDENVIEPEILEPDERLPSDLVALRRLAHLLDAAIEIPGTRRKVGLAPIVGLVPGFGDVVSAVFSSWIIIGALRHRVPTRVLLKMIANILIDVWVGSIPLIGDVFDFFFHENLGNVELLFRHRDTTRLPRTNTEIAMIALVILTTILLVAVILAFSAIVGFIYLFDAIHESVMRS